MVYGIPAGYRSGYKRGTTLLTQDNGAFCRHAPRVPVDPLPRLGGADESQHGLGKDRPLAVKTVAGISKRSRC
jgi:hypothetical protein